MVFIFFIFFIYQDFSKSHHGSPSTISLIETVDFDADVGTKGMYEQDNSTQPNEWDRGLFPSGLFFCWWLFMFFILMKLLDNLWL